MTETGPPIVPQADACDPVGHLIALLETAGVARYGMEAVDQLAHARQSAAQAIAEEADDALVVAALLHDIGHVVDAHFEGAAERSIDRRHEEIGAGFLGRWFGPEVTEPIRLHVAAKRYLCATDPAYHADLSDASRHSLDLQGGPFTAAEANAFIARPHAEAAVRLRRWDDLAKDPEAAPPSLADLRPRIEAVRRA